MNIFHLKASSARQRASPCEFDQNITLSWAQWARLLPFCKDLIWVEHLLSDSGNVNDQTASKPFCNSVSEFLNTTETPAISVLPLLLLHLCVPVPNIWQGRSPSVIAVEESESFDAERTGHTQDAPSWKRKLNETHTEVFRSEFLVLFEFS